MFDDKLARARALIEQRDQIDQELRILLGELPAPRRGRRRKNAETDPVDQSSDQTCGDASAA
jgi:hypothetical protein